MRVFLLIVTSALLSAGGYAATIPCVTGSLQDYINLGADGCTLGVVKFSDFSLEPLTSGSTLVSPAAVAVTPRGGTLTPGFDFGLNVSATPGTVRELRFSYTAMALSPGILAAAGLSMTGSAVTPDGVNTVIEDFCFGDAFTGGFCSGTTQTLLVFDIGTDAVLSETLALPSLTTLGVIKDIVVDPGVTGSASLATVTNEFAAIPEPVTMLTMPSALLAIYLVRRRLATRKGGVQ